MADEIDPEEARQAMAERHFMLSQAVIDRFEELLSFLDEAETALRGAGLTSLADDASEEAKRTRAEIEEWAAFRDEVATFLEDED